MELENDTQSVSSTSASNLYNGAGQHQENGKQVPEGQLSSVSAQPARRMSKRESNRKNAKRSTGPRTEKGKHTSRWNALKHGGAARKLDLLQTKHLPEFETYRALADDLAESLEVPLYPEERVAVQKFAFDTWRIARLHEIETQQFTRDLHGMASIDASNIIRYGTAVERAFAHSCDSIAQLRCRIEAEATAENAGAGAKAEQGTDDEGKVDSGGADACGNEGA